MILDNLLDSNDMKVYLIFLIQIYFPLITEKINYSPEIIRYCQV